MIGIWEGKTLRRGCVKSNNPREKWKKIRVIDRVVSEIMKTEGETTAK